MVKGYLEIDAELEEAALKKFYENPTSLKQFIAEQLQCEEADTYEPIARLLFAKKMENTDVDPVKLSNYILDEGNAEIAQHFFRQFDFSDKTIVEAMREIVKVVIFPVESKPIDRLWNLCASAYVDQNPDNFQKNNSDAITKTDAFMNWYMIANQQLHDEKLQSKDRMPIDKVKQYFIEALRLTTSVDPIPKQDDDMIDELSAAAISAARDEQNKIDEEIIAREFDQGIKELQKESVAIRTCDKSPGVTITGGDLKKDPQFMKMSQQFSLMPHVSKPGLKSVSSSIPLSNVFDNLKGVNNISSYTIEGAKITFLDKLFGTNKRFDIKDENQKVVARITYQRPGWFSRHLAIKTEDPFITIRAENEGNSSVIAQNQKDLLANVAASFETGSVAFEDTLRFTQDDLLESYNEAKNQASSGMSNR